MPVARKDNFKVRAKTALIQRGLSVGKLAQELGRCRTSVSQVINGHPRFPRLKRAIETYLSLTK